MMSETRHAPSSAASGSQVLQTSEPQTAFRIPGTLRLRGEGNLASSDESVSGRHIRWSENVVDNEGMGKKSSKVCCIYHKPRPVGESSSESESSGSSSSDNDSDNETDRHDNRLRCSRHAPSQSDSLSDKSPSKQNREERHTTCCTKHHRKQGNRRRPSPNAYEKMPKSATGHAKPQGS